MVLNTTWHGVEAYATSDLLIPHPTKEGYWKVFGRTDDQIMLSTGEKVSLYLRGSVSHHSLLGRQTQAH
jgi:hypothetical protein